MDPQFESYARIGLALGIGLIVGIERGWRARERPAGSRAAGIRTFTLIGLLGGVAASMGSEIAIVAGFAGVAALMVAAYVTGLPQTQDRSITGEVAALLTYGLGVLAVRGDMVLAAAAAVALVAVLNLREPIHEWIKGLEQSELTAALQLLVISVVVLPVLPNRGFGPGSLLNPFELWWIVVLIVGLTFIGQTAVRWLGAHRGIVVTALAGGLASSSAVAVSYARLAKTTPELGGVLAAGIGAATAVKFIRTLVIAAIIYPAGARPLAVALLTAAAATALSAVAVARRARGTHGVHHGKIDMGAAGDLTTAMVFAAVLAVVTLLVHYARGWFGDAGVYAVAALSGLVDVDAVTVSMTRLAAANGGSFVSAMSMAIVIALAVNTMAKLVYATAIAGRAFFPPVAGIAGSALAGLALGWALS
ncbi:MAG: DUF4010 domain-containing protein [Rhodospirillaceae bacterium]|nr:DUF4010 domain-containing protein [Rhodospirillaceae bacterium]